MTPAPWTLVDIEGKLCPAGAGNLSILTVVDEDGTPFAAVYDPSDAALIAAAPDLLEALKDARYALYGNGAGNPKIDAAIAKAEGAP